MNYYEHHIKDYAAATAHLSWVEDLAYTRLLRLYYRTERPIPADRVEVCRLIQADTPLQKQAVESVLAEFFELREDGWHQLTCDETIAKHHTRRATGYQRFRALVLARDGALCAYCGRDDLPLELDHVIPQSRGGSDGPENLTPACKPCNSSKGAMTLDEWRPA